MLYHRYPGIRGEAPSAVFLVPCRHRQARRKGRDEEDRQKEWGFSAEEPKEGGQGACTWAGKQNYDGLSLPTYLMKRG